jgi:hypothetical protein
MITSHLKTEKDLTANVYKRIYYIYCDVPPESRDIGDCIYDCSRNNGVAKHASPPPLPNEQLGTLRDD